MSPPQKAIQGVARRVQLEAYSRCFARLYH